MDLLIIPFQANFYFFMNIKELRELNEMVKAFPQPYELDGNIFLCYSCRNWLMDETEYLYGFCSTKCCKYHSRFQALADFSFTALLAS